MNLRSTTALLLALFVAPLFAQQPANHSAWNARHLILPQRQGWNFHGETQVQVTKVEANVSILEQAATTTLDIHLYNPGRTQAEASLMLPVPAGAAIGGFDFQGAAGAPTARVLPAAEARRIYDDIVRRLKDPALLEWVDFTLVQSSVFPVPAGGTQRLRLRYDHVCPADGDRIDYVLPRSESLEAIVPWNVSVTVRSERPISMVYSPSHDLVTSRKEANRQDFTVSAASQSQPGSFRLAFLRERGDLTASMIAYPDKEVGGGYFLLMAGLPSGLGKDLPQIQREVTIVLDRSGSMAGEKLDQAKAAALQVIEGLKDGEAFNLIDYSSQVASFAPRPVIKDRAAIEAVRAYLASLRPLGGTNIHGALTKALSQEPTPGMLPIVLFLTDGLPTVGITAEPQIGRVASAQNPHGRRVFTFGVGDDVNVPLLDRISDVTRAVGTYVDPGEDVEIKVAQVFRRLSGPLLADLTLETLDGQGAVTTRAMRELMPMNLPDVYEGEPLVIFGQYTSNDPLSFRLSGNLRGERRQFHFRFELDKANKRNAFVPRLWATRKIAYLVDQIRQAGAGSGLTPVNVFHDPRYKEIADEIVRLSTRFGVLSEYTAFLATEGTDLAHIAANNGIAMDNLLELAVVQRSGKSAVSQGKNFNRRKVQQSLDYFNGYWHAAGERVAVSGVQQVADRAFYKRGFDWIQGDAATKAATRTIQFGSEEHLAFARLLAAEGRQGVLSLRGNILMDHDGETVLIENH